MFRITYVLGGDKDYRDKAMRILLAGLTLVAREYFVVTPDAPSIKTFRYEEEAPGMDDWLDASACVARHRAGDGIDCEEAAAYAAGWLQAKHGISAWPQLVEKNGHTHVVVELPDGRQFDPTTLWMGRNPHDHHHACTGYGKDHPEQRITFVTDLFSPGKDVFCGGLATGDRLSHRTLKVMLYALLLVDCEWLRRELKAGRNPLWLYDAGVVYKNEPPGREDWQDWPTTIARKEADCEDLANLRASELIVRKRIQARPTFIWRRRPSGANLYHIQTTYPDGTVEDPSRRLGMGGHV